MPKRDASVSEFERANSSDQPGDFMHTQKSSMQFTVNNVDINMRDSQDPVFSIAEEPEGTTLDPIDEKKPDQMTFETK